ncbi:hypothetical protein [Bradyrhizobium sp. McL0616]|uniref:hypothetical protein n=1 Tax=Bradyrhizobium sp. McL0616 TaxID=3415674 RepID=UPI003CEECD45
MTQYYCRALTEVATIPAVIRGIRRNGSKNDGKSDLAHINDARHALFDREAAK